jgi:hypothetical protein
MVIYYFEGAVDGKVSRVVEIFENSVARRYVWNSILNISILLVGI